MGRARFLFKPRWLLSHLLVVLLIVLMVNLGFWQLRRLDEKRDRNALIEARMNDPVTAVEDLARPGVDDHVVDHARFRRVEATGTYDDDATVVVRNRSQDSVAGGWLVTPLTLSNGEQVGVIRGFVGLGDDGDTPRPAAPSGEVTVTGLAMDPGRLGGTARRDLDDFLATDGILPIVLQAQSSDPADAGPDVGQGEGPSPASKPSPEARAAGLVVLPAPELSEGPHLSYAVQWFIFSTIALVGYPIILRRVIQRRGKEAGDDRDGSDDLDRELESLVQDGR